MLKKIGLLDESASGKNNNSKSAFNRNNDSKLVFKNNNSNSKINRFVIGRNSMEHAKKLGKLFKSRKSKSKKMFKSWNFAKLREKLSKNRNLSNFCATKAKSKFLTLNTRIAFNCLQPVFIKIYLN